MGAIALCWRSRKPPPCATRDGRERLARSSSRWTRREQAARIEPRVKSLKMGAESPREPAGKLKRTVTGAASAHSSQNSLDISHLALHRRSSFSIMKHNRPAAEAQAKASRAKREAIDRERAVADPQYARFSRLPPAKEAWRGTAPGAQHETAVNWFTLWP